MNCFADDTLVVMAGDKIPMLKQKVILTLEVTTRWIKLARPSLATTKTKAVLSTHCHWFSLSSFGLKGEEILLCTALKYLGFWFNRELIFKKHAKWKAAKAERILILK